MSFLPRLFYAFWFVLKGGVGPQTIHWRLSSGLLQEGRLSVDGQPITSIEPLYPLFLAVCRHFFMDRAIFVIAAQAAISSVGAVFFYKLVLQLGKDSRVALVAAAFYSFYPYLIRQTAAMNETTLLTTLLIATAFFYGGAAQVWNTLFCGLAFGLAFLTRAMVLPIGLLGVAALCWRRRFLSAGVLSLAATGVVSFLSFSGLYSSFLPQRVGWDLAKVNNERIDKIIPYRNPDELNPYLLELAERRGRRFAGADPGVRDGFYLREALRWMRENPWQALKLKCRNVFYFLGPRIVPYNPGRRPAWVEWTHGLIYGFILTTAVGGLYLRRLQWREDLFLYFIALDYLIVYSIFWPATRYRVSMDFIPMFYSAYCITRLTTVKKVLN